MLLRGEDVADALREWVKSELKEGPRQAYDLGKFFFTVSIGTVGAIGTVEKLNVTPALDGPLRTSLGLLTLSILAALGLAFPRVQRVNGDTDLFERYRTQIRFTQAAVVLWALLWGAGLVFGMFAVHS